MNTECCQEKMMKKKILKETETEETYNLYKIYTIFQKEADFAEVYICRSIESFCMHVLSLLKSNDGIF